MHGRVDHESLGRSLHLVGYCMGGTLSAMLTALRPELVRTLTLLAAHVRKKGRRAARA